MARGETRCGTTFGDNRYTSKRRRAALALAAASVLGGIGLAGSAAADITLNNSTHTVTYFGQPIVNGLNELYYTGTFTGNNDARISPLDPGVNLSSFLNSNPAATNVLNVGLGFDDNDNVVDTLVNINTRAGNLYTDVNPDPVVTDLNNIGALYYGTVTVGGTSSLAAGQVSFGTGSDDGSNVFVDSNQDGVFQASEQVVSNLGPHGVVLRTGTVNLAAGTYKIGIGFYEGNGGGSLDARFASGAVTDFNAMSRIDPSQAAQAGVWGAYTTPATPPDHTADNLNVSGNSTLNLTNALGTQFAQLNLSGGSTLNVVGRPSARFTGTNLTGSATLNNEAIVTLGPVNGAVGTLTKQGPGRVVIGNGGTGFSPSSTLNIQAGQVDTSAGATGGALNGATISLNGGTLRATGVEGPGAENALRQSFYNFSLGGAHNLEGNGGWLAVRPSGANLLTSTPTRSGEIRFNNDNDFMALSGGVTGIDNYGFTWTGTFTPHETGSYRFAIGAHQEGDPAAVLNGLAGLPANDDDASAFIDLNGNGIMDGGTERLFQRGCCGTAASGEVQLTAGTSYKIAFATTEFGGGSAYNISYAKGFDQGEGLPLGYAFALVNPADPFLGTFRATTDLADYSASAVNVTGNSSIIVDAFDGVNFGALTLTNGSTLNITNGVVAPGVASFASTGGTGAVTINNASSTRTGVITGAFSSITKLGGGKLFLDDTTAASALTGATTINVNAGTLVVTGDSSVNPVGGAAIRLGGGSTLALSSKGGGVILGNSITAATGSSTIIARMDGASANPGNLVDLTTVAVATDATANLRTADDYILNVGSVNFTGNGSATVGSGVSVMGVNVGANTGRVSTLGTGLIKGDVVGTGTFIASQETKFDPASTPTQTITVGATTQVDGRVVAMGGTLDFGNKIVTGIANTKEGGVGYYYDLAANPATTDFDSLGTLNQIYQALTPTVTAPTTTGGKTELSWTNGGAFGTGAPFADQGFNDLDAMVQIIRGQIVVPADGMYTFSTRSDDGSMVYIDGNVVVNNNFYQGATTRTGQVFLTAGMHDFVTSFYEGGGGAGVQVSWGLNPAALTLVQNSSLRQSARLEAENGATIIAGGVSNIDALSLNGNNFGTTIQITQAGEHTAGLLMSTNDSRTTLDLVNAGARLTTNAISVSGSEGMRKIGAGALRVTGGGSINGPLAVEAGKVFISGPTTGTGPISVASGTTFGGNGSFGGMITVEGGARLQPHDDVAGAIGTLTTEGLTFNAGTSDLDFNFGTTTDRIVTNTLDWLGAAELNVNNVDGFRSGRFMVLDYNSETGTPAFTLGTTPNTTTFPFTYSLENDATESAWFLNIIAPNFVWKGAVNGSWEIGGPANWNNGASNVPWIELVEATFDDTGTNTNITIAAGGVTPANMVVDSSLNYTFGGGAIKGTGGLTKSGTGTLALNNTTSTFTGPVSVTGGTLAFASVADIGTPSALGQGALPINVDSATLDYTGAAAGSTNRSFTIGAGGATINSAQPLTISGTVTSAGDLTKTGAGTVALSSTTNDLAGSISVNQGTLSVGSIGTTVNSGANLNVGSATPGTFAYTGASTANARNLVIGAGGGTVNVANADTTLTLSGSNSGPTINKTGPGTLTLSGQTILTGTAHTVAEGRINYTNPTPGNAVGGTYAVPTGATLGAVAGGINASTVVNLNGGTYALMGGGPISSVPVLTGFGDGSGYSVIGTGQALIEDPNRAVLTNETNDNRNAIWNNTARDITSFVVQFTYTREDPGNNNPNPADGVTFTLQNDPRGLAALGDGGGALAYGGAVNGVTPSVSLQLDIWGDGGRGITTNVNGAVGGYVQPGGIDMISQNPKDVVAVYENGNVTMAITDTVTGETFTRSLTGVNIPALVGGNTAILGFTGATGGANALQVISNFSYGNSPSAVFGTPINVAAGSNSTIEVSTLMTTTTGPLTFLGADTTLNVTGTLGTVAPSSVSMTSGGAYTINTTGGAAIALGHPNTGGIATTINKTGTGTATITSSAVGSPTSEFVAGSALNVGGGVLGLVGGAGFKNVVGAAGVNLTGGEAALSSRGGDLNYNNTQFTATSGILSARQIGTGAAGAINVTAGSAAKPVTVNAGGSLELAARDGYTLNVPNLHFAGNGTVSNTTTDTNVNVGTITSAPGAVATVGGTRSTTITGPVGAGELVVARGATAGLTPSGAIQSVNAPVKVDGGTFAVRSNVVDTGGRSITGVFGEQVVGFLAEGRVAGAFNDAAANPSTELVQGTRRANQANVTTPDDGTEVAGWVVNSTYIYTGQMFIPDADASGTDKIAFGEQFDDSVLIRIDGVERLRDGNWDDSTSTGVLDLTSGWHDVEFRFGQGGGGVGPVAGQAGGWNGQLGFGIQIDESLGFDARSDGPTVGAFATQSKYLNPAALPDRFRATANAAAGGIVDVAAGAELRSGALVNVGTVKIGDGSNAVIAENSPTSRVGSLEIAGATDAWTGKLDLKNNDMVIPSTAAGRDGVHDRLFNQLKAGIDAANPAGFWAGTTGITSSTAAANQSGFLTSIGMIVNDYATANLGTGPVLTDIGGVAVDINDVIMKYTWAGDADLNGTIDGGDYFLIDNGFAQSLVDGGWLNGDFDYNGVIDGGDFFLIDNSFSQQGTTVLASRGAVASAVPEPGVLGLLAVGSLGLLSRRRRRA